MDRQSFQDLSRTGLSRQTPPEDVSLRPGGGRSRPARERRADFRADVGIRIIWDGTGSPVQGGKKLVCGLRLASGMLRPACSLRFPAPASEPLVPVSCRVTWTTQPGPETGPGRKFPLRFAHSSRDKFPARTGASLRCAPAGSGPACAVRAVRRRRGQGVPGTAGKRKEQPRWPTHSDMSPKPRPASKAPSQ